MIPDTLSQPYSGANAVPALDYSTPIVPAHREPRIIDAAVRALVQLRDRCPSCTTAMMLTEDGFEIARESAVVSDDQRLASMSSSLQALTEALARELALGATRYSMIEAEHGAVLIIRVPDQRIVLSAVFDDLDTAGRLLRITRRVVADFSAQLAANTTPVPTHESKERT